MASAMLSYSILPIPRALRFGGVARRALPVAVVMLFAAGRAAVAQVGVRGDRDLAFGSVTRGIPAAVPPSDPVKSGQWTITAPPRSRVQIRMTLPVNLNGPSGATMPIVFGKNDAYAQESGGSPQYFNPNGFQVYAFGNTGTAIVRLGGQVTPNAGQAAGTYVNTVLLTMTILN